jgi:hypothetical protein
MGSPHVPASADAPARPPAGRPLGELQRGDVQWTVLLETRPHPRAQGARGSLQGRLHFVRDGGDAVRSTGWIFVESGETELLVRFSEFSAVELWHLLDSLA